MVNQEIFSRFMRLAFRDAMRKQQRKEDTLTHKCSIEDYYHKRRCQDAKLIHP